MSSKAKQYNWQSESSETTVMISDENNWWLCSLSRWCSQLCLKEKRTSTCNQQAFDQCTGWDNVSIFLVWTKQKTNSIQRATKLHTSFLIFCPLHQNYVFCVSLMMCHEHNKFGKPFQMKTKKSKRNENFVTAYKNNWSKKWTVDNRQSCWPGKSSRCKL